MAWNYGWTNAKTFQTTLLQKRQKDYSLKPKNPFSVARNCSADQEITP